MPSRLATALLLVAPLSVAACSSDSDAGPPISSDLSRFARYCTGTLKVEKTLMVPVGAAAWMGDGSAKAPAGTTFLVAEGFSRFEGYVIRTDGSPAKISADFKAGLVKDVDFTSECADLAAADRTVLLSDATFFANPERTGTACKLEAATELTSFSFMSSGDYAKVSAEQIKTTCALDVSYSSDIHYGSLLPR